MSIKTNRKFQDVSAWYHIVVAFDTTQSTASNRVKFYVNGVQETSFSSSNYPAQNLDLMLNVNSSLLQELVDIQHHQLYILMDICARQQ